ncbi:MAG: hypothetical protein HZA04_02125 [Nitrospinae bacterium]|nr:hypothetical protein [Nitrospinota bacterium]
MFRITNQMMYNNSLINMYRQNEGMFNASEQISSGKRVNKPSDDPLAIGEIMQYQTRLDRNDRYTIIAQKARGYLGTSESLVASATDAASRALELSMSQASANATPQTRLTTAAEIDNLIAQAIQIGNSKIGSDFIFGGRRTNDAPVTAAGYYTGDHTSLQSDISEGATIGSSVLASEFLTADLNPRLNGATLLSSLRGGAGVTAGTFTITDRAGAAGTVNVTAGMTVAGLIAGINASGANVTASIAADGMGIQIKDNNTSTVTGPLVIANGSGAAASEMGLAGSRSVTSFKSDDLNPALTASTLISDLSGGTGMTLSNISVVNGSASATVSFAGASTIGDVINAINASGTNVTAALNPTSNALTVTSNNAATVAFANDIGSGKTAERLGVGGGRNLIASLQKLSAALKGNDVKAIAGLMENFSSAVNTSTALRGEIGARMNRVDTTSTQLEQSKADTTTLLSNAQDADMAKAISDFALLQTAYQATAKATASIIQPSLIDFLR